MTKFLTLPEELLENRLFSRMYANSKKATALLFLLLLNAGMAMAQTLYVQAPPVINGTSSNSRGPNGAVDFQRTAALYLGSEVVGFPAATPIKSLGFNIATPAATAATGNIKVYLVNTADATFSRSTTWTDLISTPSAMQLVYDGPLTVPASAGFYDINFQTPFNYTGGNFYLAYEWSTTTKSAASAVYNANTDLANGLRTATGTALPATLTGVSAFRPVLRLGYTPPPNDVNVKAVYSLGKLPMMPATTPHVVRAMIINTGGNAQTNLVVSLAVTGANTFNTTTTIPTLASGDTAMVSFPGFTPTATGANTITVSVPNDDINSNNSGTYSQIVTTGALSYAEGNPPVHTTGLRPLAPNGTLLAKFHVDGSQVVTIPTVRLFISFDPNNVGNTVYAVIQDSLGNEIGRSANYVIQTADLSMLKDFAITTPPTLTNTDFYVGMAVVPGTANYFPMGVQAENPVRPNTFYTGPIAGGSRPTNLTSTYRVIVEPQLVAVSGNDAGVSAFISPTSKCSLTSSE
ncbi:MAG: hypothetical protein LPJ89_01205, partial [Hymenobacteraceae bacterium]|nr:hypothetical protein [Hymenobacteraceae bacterium]